jgi:hypothetical protein
MKMSTMGKCQIKHTNLLDVTVVTIINIGTCYERIDITIEIIPKNDKFCLQSLGLWSFTIVFQFFTGEIGLLLY